MTTRENHTTYLNTLHRRNWITWVWSGLTAAGLNLMLYLLMPHLIDPAPSRQSVGTLVPQVNVIRIKRPEPTVKRKDVKPPPDPPKAKKPRAPQRPMQTKWKENLVHALLAADMQRRALPYIRELAAVYTGDKQIQWQEILLYQYVKLDRRAEALAYARMLTRRAPTIAKWWKALTHILLNDGQSKEALAALTIYSFLSPLTMAEKQLLADLNLQLEIPVKAAPVYETCLQAKPDKKLLQRLASAYRQLGRPDTALERVDAFQIDPEDADLMLLKGELHYQLKQFDKAAAAYRKAAQHKGKHVGRAWLMAGYAAWQMDDIAASKKAFAKAREHTRQKKAATAALKQLARVSIQDSQQRKEAHHDSGL